MISLAPLRMTCEYYLKDWKRLVSELTALAVLATVFAVPATEVPIFWKLLRSMFVSDVIVLSTLEFVIRDVALETIPRAKSL